MEKINEIPLQLVDQESNWMLETFMEGGIIYMLILTLFLLIICAVFILEITSVFRNKNISLLIGLFTFLLGILFTGIGLIGAFDSIEAAGDISPSLVAGGIKVSLITLVFR